MTGTATAPRGGARQKAGTRYRVRVVRVDPRDDDVWWDMRGREASLAAEEAVRRAVAFEGAAESRCSSARVASSLLRKSEELLRGAGGMLTPDSSGEEGSLDSWYDGR